MTPVTADGSSAVFDKLATLQRIRGRMTPVTRAGADGANEQFDASTDPGPDDPGDQVGVAAVLPRT